MKNKFLVSIAFLTSILVFNACKKYEENPLINLWPKKDRLMRNDAYTVAGFWVDGMDSTHTVAPIGYIGFREERGGYKYLYTPLFGGTWDFSDHKKTLNIIADRSSYPCGVLLIASKLEWRITKLTDRELHMNTDFNGKHYIVHLNKDKS